MNSIIILSWHRLLRESIYSLPAGKISIACMNLASNNYNTLLRHTVQYRWCFSQRTAFHTQAFLFWWPWSLLSHLLHQNRTFPHLSFVPITSPCQKHDSGLILLNALKIACPFGIPRIHRGKPETLVPSGFLNSKYDIEWSAFQ